MSVGNTTFSASSSRKKSLKSLGLWQWSKLLKNIMSQSTISAVGEKDAIEDQEQEEK